MTVQLVTRLACLFLLLVASTGCESSSYGVPHMDKYRLVVTVFAAVSTTNAMEEVSESFTRATGFRIQANYAASSTLAQQIALGAEPDVFLSANVAWADHIQTLTAKRRNLLGNRLVVVVPSNSEFDLQSPEDLLRQEVEHLALADTDSVPAGRYARQALIELDLWNRLEARVVPGKDVRHALLYVETGVAEAGIVYATDAAVSNKVKVVLDVPVGLTEPVVYPAMLLECGADKSAARRFYDFLGSPEATRIFEKYGFTVIR